MNVSRDDVEELLTQATPDELQTIKKSIAFDAKKEKFSTDLIMDIITPNYIGPSWENNNDGSWSLPEFTLGWEIAGWCTRYLLDPRDPNKPFRFTLEQLRLILWFYAVDIEGRFIYRSGVIQRLKGWGKDPLLAVICIVEFVGPCRFSHWKDGKPVGRPELASIVQVAASTAEQTSNTSGMFPILMSDDLKRDYGVKGSAASEVIRAHMGRQKIEMVSSNWRALEGKRTTFSLLNEALDINTDIPTPGGMVKMGDLQDGDIIYGADGKPVTVTKAHDIQIGRRCFKVTLSNGVDVIASDGHLWDTGVSCSAAKRKIRTTLEMFEDGRRFTLPRAGLRESENIDLVVDPYLMGYWLGDGSTGACNITIGDQDAEAIVAEMAKRGIDLHRLKTGEGKAGRFSFSEKKGFGSEMGGLMPGYFRTLPCFRDKHILDMYFESGHEQRLELLRGLMDSDGCYSTQGQCIFVGNKQLAYDVFALAISLGLLPHIKFAPDSRSRHGGTWRVSFNAEGVNPFSLPRKADRVVIRERRKTVAVVGIEEVESVPVRCISVDAEDSLFQAGHGIVTHNTHHWLGPEGRRMAEVISDNTTKMDGRWLAITNAYMPGEESVAELHRQDYEEAVRIAGVSDPIDAFLPGEAILYDSVEARSRAPLGGPLAPLVLRNVIGDAYWLERQIPAMISSARRQSISVARSRRMWLNQIMADDDALVTDDMWRECFDQHIELRRGDKIVMGFDGGKSDDATALVALRLRDKAVFVLGVWENTEDEIGWEVDRAEVNESVHRSFNDYEVVAFYADVNLWESYIEEWVRDHASKLAVKASERSPIGFDMRGSQARLTYAHERMLSAIMDARMKHDGNVDLRQHVLNARRKENRWGVSFGKESRESPKKVDLYAAMMLAHEAAWDFQVRGKEVKKRSNRGYFF